MQATFFRRTAASLGCLGVLGSAALSLARSQAVAPSQLSVQKAPLTLAKDTRLPMTLPYHTWQGLIVLVGTVNGMTPPERFVLDTSLNACAITPGAGSRLALPTLPSQVRVAILDQSDQRAPEARIASLQFAGMKLENVPIALFNVFGSLSRSNRTDAPTCWLGFPFLSTFQVTFDFTQHLVTLNAPKTPMPDEPETIVVPFTLRDGRIWVKVAVPGVRPFNALMNTGTPGTLLPTEVAEKLKLKPQEVMTVTRSGNKETRAALGTVPKMSIGKAEWKDVRAVFYAVDAPPEFDRTLAVLGIDFWSHYKVTIDYAKQKIALAPLASPETEEETASSATSLP